MNAVLKDSSGSGAIHPFQYEATDAELADLRRRIDATRLPERETVADATQGVPLATIQNLMRHWATKYDWRKIEAKLNAYPNFITEIDGLDIHFIHVRSKHENALPVIITHGWPGSVIEQLKIVEPLVNPTAHGGTAADAFHLVIPSIPGFGFSGKPSANGWGPERIARAWATLMDRLGYTKYAAQGGDWGALITEHMAVQAPPGLVGIHTNFPAAVPPPIVHAAATGGAMPENLSEEETRAWERLKFFFEKGIFYALEMATRPQTLYGLADSPVSLAAWMLDHDERSLAMIARSFAGENEGLTPDDVLDNITLAWLTNTGVSSARLYWENRTHFFVPNNVQIPVAVSIFPDELYAAPRHWVEKAYPKLVHYNQLPKGGHFAAWEQPALFVPELRAGLASLR